MVASVAGAQDAIEVKDAETLWKVNIEAVYRRKNPPGSPRDPAVLPGVEAGGRTDPSDLWFLSGPCCGGERIGWTTWMDG